MMGDGMGLRSRSAFRAWAALVAVALDLEEADGVVDQLLEQGAAGRDPERRRGAGEAGDHDPGSCRAGAAGRSRCGGRPRSGRSSRRSAGRPAR